MKQEVVCKQVAVTVCKQVPYTVKRKVEYTETVNVPVTVCKKVEVCKEYEVCVKKPRYECTYVPCDSAKKCETCSKPECNTCEKPSHLDGIFANLLKCLPKCEATKVLGCT